MAAPVVGVAFRGLGRLAAGGLQFGRQKIQLTIKGIKKALRNIDGVQRVTDPTMEDTLFRWGIRVMDTASPMIPVDTGHLRNSWFVLTKRHRSMGPEAGNLGEFRSQLPTKQPMVIFGNTAPYAALQHAIHKTKSQWVTRAIRQHRNTLPELARTRYRSAFGRFRA